MPKKTAKTVFVMGFLIAAVGASSPWLYQQITKRDFDRICAALSQLNSPEKKNDHAAHAMVMRELTDSLISRSAKKTLMAIQYASPEDRPALSRIAAIDIGYANWDCPALFNSSP